MIQARKRASLVFLSWNGIMKALSMQDHGKEMVKMKAVEGQRRVRNQPTRDVCFHGFNKHTNTSHGTFLFVYFGFYLVLKSDLIEETLVANRKCVDYQIGTHLSILKHTYIHISML